MNRVEITLGKECDIDSWMNLVNKVKKNFPGLETKEALAEHRNTVLDFMHKESAICAKSNDKIVGALLFSKDNNMLCFLAVDTEYRRQHIAEKMMSYMLTFLDLKKDVVVTTYREGVPEGKAARAFYKYLGFVEGEMTEEFGSPVQEFVLRRNVMGELSKLPNIGKTVEAQLVKVGINSVDDLRKIGAKEAWLKIQEIDESACINRLMALEGAVEGVKKTMLTDEVKADLKEFYQRNKR